MPFPSNAVKGAHGGSKWPAGSGCQEKPCAAKSASTTAAVLPDVAPASLSETSVPQGSGKWTCSRCLLRFEPSVVKCPVCVDSSVSEGVEAPVSGSVGIRVSFGFCSPVQSEAHKYRVAMTTSETSERACAAHLAANLQAAPVFQMTASLPQQTEPMAQTGGRWCCPRCLLNFESSVATCPVCHSGDLNRSASSACRADDIGTAPEFNNISAPARATDGKEQARAMPVTCTSMPEAVPHSVATQPRGNKWSCPRCLLCWQLSATKCPVCETPQPTHTDLKSNEMKVVVAPAVSASVTVAESASKPPQPLGSGPMAVPAPQPPQQALEPVPVEKPAPSLSNRLAPCPAAAIIAMSDMQPHATLATRIASRLHTLKVAGQPSLYTFPKPMRERSMIVNDYLHKSMTIRNLPQTALRSMDLPKGATEERLHCPSLLTRQRERSKGTERIDTTVSSSTSGDAFNNETRPGSSPSLSAQKKRSLSQPGAEERASQCTRRRLDHRMLEELRRLAAARRQLRL
eukprot:gnl/TRDRNA2_/TRDRNA2_126201_c0_seq1.p1 gnl/TRDRNA2_/TRDRNA2_126201_c0~~gnl/TRDRNA2_/TRDRNA2_126201_c0_seq1.p1  ORF type:complete len:516 (+),score=48.91 gnl/TRDRNA2_/TRDRNA2_126201_c0_seq1:65-1612(+)